MGIEDQINEMLEGLEPTPQKEEPDETAAPTQEEGKADESKEEPTQETAPAEEVQAETTESVEREPVKEEVAVAEVVESPAEDPRYVAMQETINRLSAQLLQAGVQPPQSAPPTAAPPVAAQPPPSVEVDLSKFQVLPEGVDFEDVVNDKASFEKFMRDLLVRFNTVRVRQDALAIPMMVSRQVQSLNTLNDVVRSFYDTNKDLVAFKPLVGAYCNRIVAEHPDWTLPQVLTEAANQSRSSIGAGMAAQKPTTPVTPKAPAAPIKPSFATTTATRNVPAKAHETKMAKEIAELIADI